MVNKEVLQKKADFINGLASTLTKIDGVNGIKYEAFEWEWDGNIYPAEFVTVKMGRSNYVRCVNGNSLEYIVKEIALIINKDSFSDNKEEYYLAAKKKRIV